MKRVLGIFLIFNSVSSFAVELCEPRVDSCGFYLCQEKNHLCGPKGYPLGFGFKFCQVYLQTQQNYSPAAHAWLQRVRVCLMNEFTKEEAENPSRTCREIKSQSFHSHVGCYVRTGFCELTGMDHLRIFWAMRSSFHHLEILRDAQGIAKGCAKLTSY
jgi:hypothetical protein